MDKKSSRDCPSCSNPIPIKNYTSIKTFCIKCGIKTCPICDIGSYCICCYSRYSAHRGLDPIFDKQAAI